MRSNSETYAADKSWLEMVEDGRIGADEDDEAFIEFMDTEGYHMAKQTMALESIVTALEYIGVTLYNSR